MSRKYAEAILADLKENNYHGVMYGDGILVDYGDLIKTKNNHPLNIVKLGLNILEKHSDLFVKGYTYAHDLKGNPRKVRSFRIKQQERT